MPTPDLPQLPGGRPLAVFAERSGDGLELKFPGMWNREMLFG